MHSAGLLQRTVAASVVPTLQLPAGGMEQVDRMERIANIRDFKLRIIVSTDLIARGVDLGTSCLTHGCQPWLLFPEPVLSIDLYHVIRSTQRLPRCRSKSGSEALLPS